MNGSQIAVFVLGGMVVAATLLPFIRSERWWIRGLDFPRLQVAALALLALVGAHVLAWPDRVLEWLFVGALVLCFTYQLSEVYPYTRLAKKQVKPTPGGEQGRISLLLANVLISNRRSQDFLKIVRQCQPDIVLTVETDARWAAELAELDTAYAHTLKRPQENSYGMLLYSRLPLLHPEIRALVEADIPSMHAQVQLDGRPVALHFLHPRPPAPQEDNESTERDAELVMIARQVKAEPMPAIVAGDLNDVAWSHTTRLFQRISRLLDPRIGRGMFNTYHARYPFLRWPLDHVFHSDHFTLIRLKRLPYFGSDHFPIFVELALTPEQSAVQEAPPVGPEHEAEARAKVDRARDRQE